MIDDENQILYITAQQGNFIYKIDIADLDNPIIQKVSLNEASPTTISWLNPNDLKFSPDGSKYCVCQPLFENYVG